MWLRTFQRQLWLSLDKGDPATCTELDPHLLRARTLCGATTFAFPDCPRHVSLSFGGPRWHTSLRLSCLFWPLAQGPRTRLRLTISLSDFTTGTWPLKINYSNHAHHSLSSSPIQHQPPSHHPLHGQVHECIPLPGDGPARFRQLLWQGFKQR